MSIREDQSPHQEWEATSKQDLAQERTDWAFARTILAKERTYSAWVRTGLAAVAAGLGITRLLQTLEPRWAVYTLGALLVCTGGMMFALSFWRYRQPLDDDAVNTGAPVWLIGLLTGALFAAAALGLWLLW